MSSRTLAVTTSAGRTTGAVIESSIGSLEVTRVFDLDEGADAVEIAAAGPFDRIVAAAPAEAAAFRLLDLPFRDRRRVSQAVGPALEEHVPWSLDDGVLAWDFAGAGSDPAAAGASVLAALAAQDRIDAASARVGELVPEAAPHRLLWAPSAVLTAYRHAVGADASFVAVDLGDAGAVIARVESGRVASLRVLAACDDELLLRNVAWSLATVGASQERAVVGGRHGARLRAALAKRVPSMRFEELPAASPVPGLAGRDWRELTVVAGLILATGGDALPPLLDFASASGSLLGLPALEEIRSEARPLVRWAAAALALAVIAVGIDYVQLFAERSALAARAEQVYTSAMPSPSGGAGRKLKMEMKLKELAGKSASGAVSGSPLALLAALSRDVPKSLDVTVDQVDHAPPSARVTGHAPSFEAVTKMQEALQKGGAFTKVDVKDAHAAVTGGGVEFLLELVTPPASGGGA